MLESREHTKHRELRKRKSHWSGLLLAISVAMLPQTSAVAYDLAASDMAAYRSDVVGRIFDAVKNSPAYARTVIQLNLTALGKITSCKVVKSSGSADLDTAMMKALSEVKLQPMRFASSSSDTMQIQLCFANPVPDPKNLYVFKNESFQYRSFGTLMQISGPAEDATGGLVLPDRVAARIGAFRTTSGGSLKSAVPVTSSTENYSKADRDFDAEIKKLLDSAPAELSFDNLQYGLNQVPESSAQLDKSAEYCKQNRYLAAAQALILALPEPYKSGDTEAVRTILDKLRKLSTNLKDSERFNISMSLVNFSERVHSRMPFGAPELQAKNAASVNAILSTAQQFLEESSSKNLARLALYYQSRGKIYQEINNVDKAKISFQKSLSIMLENNDAQPAEIEMAFDTAINFLSSQDDTAAVQEVENQRAVWESKHPDPTNLFAINAACKQLQMVLRQNKANQADDLVERILRLISTSTLSTTDKTYGEYSRLAADGNSRSKIRNDLLTRTLQELARTNTQLSARDRRSTPSSSTERLMKETFKLAVRTHNIQQQSASQQLVDYLTENSKAQEALVLCDMMESLDAEDSTLVQRARSNTLQQSRLRALRALGRTQEAIQIDALIKKNLESRTQSNIQRNIAVAESRIAKAAPYSTERVQARTTLVTNLLAQPKPDIQRAKENFLDSLHEVLSEKYPAYSMSDYWDLSNQFSAILAKTEPDLEFTTNAMQGLLRMQYRRTAGSLISEAQFGRAMPLTTILNNAAFERNPKVHLALIRHLVKFCDEQHIQDDTNRLILLRKQADLESKLNDTASATRTNLSIVSLLEKNKTPNKPELVKQLLLLARAEANDNKIAAARKHERQAAELNFAATDAVAISLSLAELSKAYAARGALRYASDALLEAVRVPVPQSSNKHGLSARNLVHACAEYKQMAVAKDFLKDAIEFEKVNHPDSTMCNLYRFEFAAILFEESVAIKKAALSESLWKESEQVFAEAADDLTKSQGVDSKFLGQEVQRRAFVLNLNNMKDRADALLEKYKAAAANAGGGSLTLDTNVGTPSLPATRPNSETIEDF
ncbi:MAG TPA: energy transducer TonB [Drouetiella sp.]|jgi:TonB family protein